MSTNFNKPLNSYANLFKSGEEIAANENETTSSEFTNEIEINKLKPFSKHPFKAHSSQKLKGDT